MIIWISGFSLVYQNFNSGKNQYREALRKLANYGLEFALSLGKGELDRCGEIISANWQAQKELVASTSKQETDEMYDFAIAHGAIGGKLCGAGNGGCFIFYTHDKVKLGDRLQQRFKKGLVLAFRFEYRDIKSIN